MKRPKSKTPIVTADLPIDEEMAISAHPKYGHYRKYEWTGDFLGNVSGPPVNHAFHEITEDEINTCDTSRLIDDLKADPDNPLVKAGPGQLVLSVRSDPDHPSNVLVKPEFRDFVKKADQQGVCWIYFVMPGASDLRIFLAAGGSGSKIEAITKDSIEITCLPADLFVFLHKQLKRYYSLCKLAGISLGSANAHLKALIEPQFPVIQLVPLSSRKMFEPPQSMIDAYRRVNPNYVPGKSVVKVGEMISEIFMAKLLRQCSE